MLRIALLLLLAAFVTLHEVERNAQWEYDDPRWDTKIPNWWDQENFVPPVGPAAERSRKFWVDQGQNLLKEKLQQQHNTNKAKNLVIFIGDGMGLSTQMAARAYKGDVNRELTFEKFRYSGLSKTYCVNYQVPDSASSATAIFSGIKTNFDVLSLTASVEVRNCSSQSIKDNQIDSIFKYAQDAGKATGIITTTRITHATPAAAYARSASRYWEFNVGDAEGCHDIAYQLIHGEVGSKLDVILGGGRRSFFPNTSVTENNERGFRTDNLNLIEDYKIVQKSLNKSVVYVETKEQLMNVDAAQTDKILGLFAHSHMEYKLLSSGSNQPTLKEMTEKALEMLSKNENGFVLMVEGGRIDHGHHETRARIALEEVLEFDKTVEMALTKTNVDDTLTVVTADHSHVFTVGGYSPRGRNILGVGDYSREDQMWFFSLSYANGPGHDDHIRDGSRRNPRGMHYADPSFRQPTTVPKVEETHSGEDVGVYAKGPFEHIFSGVYEQSYIAHAMAYATCLGPEEFMKHPKCSATEPTNDAPTAKLAVLATLCCVFMLMLANLPFRLSHE